MSDHVWLEHAAPYALGALDETDHAAFDEHLETCDNCAREVRELRQVAGLLALGGPAVAPPPALRDRILAEARGVRPISARRGNESTGPSDAAVITGRSAPHSMAASGRAWRVVVPWLAAAAAIVVAVGLAQRLRVERDARLAAEHSVASARAALDSTGATLAGRDSLIATLVAPDVQAMTVTGAGPTPSARYFLDRRARRIVIAASSLPAAAPGRTYQLWGIETGKPPVSLGTFDADASGRALASLSVPDGLAISVTAVTDEPVGGSPQPTTTPFLAATW
jgi:anti-sigma-K factor RskA